MFLLRNMSVFIVAAALFVGCNGGPPGPADEYRGQWEIQTVRILEINEEGHELVVNINSAGADLYSRTSMWLTKGNVVRSEIYFQIDEDGSNPIIFTEQLRDGVYSVSDNMLRVDWDDGTFDECELSNDGRSFTRMEVNPFDNRTWIFQYEKITD
jgi:hypothetical protein